MASTAAFGVLAGECLLVHANLAIARALAVASTAAFGVLAGECLLVHFAIEGIVPSRKLR